MINKSCFFVLEEHVFNSSNIKPWKTNHGIIDDGRNQNANSFYTITQFK